MNNDFNKTNSELDSLFLSNYIIYLSIDKNKGDMMAFDDVILKSNFKLIDYINFINYKNFSKERTLHFCKTLINKFGFDKVSCYFDCFNYLDYKDLQFINGNGLDNFDDSFNSDKPYIYSRKIVDADYGGPVSFGGNVYEWDRGVIGISSSGVTNKYSLDGTVKSHSYATSKVGDAFGVNVDYDATPYDCARIMSNNGYILIQFEGDMALVYFPDYLTSLQVNSLKECMTPRANFSISFVHKDDIFEYSNFKELMDYAEYIMGLSKGMGM